MIKTEMKLKTRNCQMQEQESKPSTKSSTRSSMKLNRSSTKLKTPILHETNRVLKIRVLHN